MFYSSCGRGCLCSSFLGSLQSPCHGETYIVEHHTDIFPFTAVESVLMWMWCVFIPEPLFALFWCELVKSFGLLLAEEGFVVVVEILLIVVLLVAERSIVMDSVLFLHRFSGDVSYTKRNAQQQRPEIHPVLSHAISCLQTDCLRNRTWS